MMVGERLYAIDDGGTLFILDARTGQEVAKQKVGRAMFGSMVYGDGKFYVVDANGSWSVLRPTDKGVEVVHKLRMGDMKRCWDHPSSLHGRIYIADQQGALLHRAEGRAALE